MGGGTLTPRDLLARIEAEGVTASLKLRLAGDAEPSPETLELLRHYRDDLIIYLTMQSGDTLRMCRLSEHLKTGAVWCKGCYRYQLRPCIPSEKRYEDRHKP